MTTIKTEWVSCTDVPLTLCTQGPLTLDAGPQRNFIVQTANPDILAVRFWVASKEEPPGYWCDVHVDTSEVVRAATAATGAPILILREPKQ